MYSHYLSVIELKKGRENKLCMALCPCKSFGGKKNSQKHSSPFFNLSKYRLNRTGICKVSSESKHISVPNPIHAFLTTKHKDGCFTPTFNPLLVVLFPYLQLSLLRIPESLIRSLYCPNTLISCTSGFCLCLSEWVTFSFYVYFFSRLKLPLICEKKRERKFTIK